eukprot:TRINITY_DN26746_c0_g2_i1.p1 TRINITY_DN26746_c0_g2~~TRINITY_DN26746_c0_g2_i1.p1  ORF type:complete len:187 (-),score=28.98 TRINITY_DN26746_c0_g2_i1:55-615(-)
MAAWLFGRRSRGYSGASTRGAVALVLCAAGLALLSWTSREAAVVSLAFLGLAPPRNRCSHHSSSTALGAVASEALGLASYDTREDYESNVRGFSTVVAMFSSPMCGPCHLVEPKINEMAKDFSDQGVKFFKVSLTPGKNVKELKPLFSELEVRELPTFIVYKDGEAQGRVTGTRHEELRQLVEGVV